MNAVPAKYFAFPPYRAEDLGGKMKWWGVMNRDGLNVLTLTNKPGAVVTTEERAKQIADEWNETKEFVYPPDLYVPPVTTRMTDEEMRSRVHK